MNNLLVEVIGTHNCTGCGGSVPDVVQKFTEQTGKQVEFKFYPIWDIENEENIPDYILFHISEMKKGLDSSNGFFLNGQWLPLAHHNTDHVVQARNKLVESAELEQDKKGLDLSGHMMDSINLDGSDVKKIMISNSKTQELGCFSTSFDGIWFFEGSIKELRIDACPVEKFFYAGYDINKLIEKANQYPEIFGNSGNESVIQEVHKADIDDVEIRLLNEMDLSEGYHPCIINGCRIDKNSKLHKAVAEKFGGWGYAATCNNQVCGYMGIMPKDISYRDANFLPPSELPNESILLFTCYAGGGVFAPHFHRIGIATKMINQAINDAKTKNYLRIEAYAHPEVVLVLKKCGFTRVEWNTEKNSPQEYYKLDL